MGHGSKLFVRGLTRFSDHWLGHFAELIKVEPVLVLAPSSPLHPFLPTVKQPQPGRGGTWERNKSR
ncbi:hypothetical protein L484_013378 [Morus notabilis]|uniref:Uncharacterized protein n=1 Tax=Morus notabilis TaxID=981085 RepID=W9R9L1_9ROSA|nr:hypothetical protein L484_013378 [Morus notabilis]